MAKKGQTTKTCEVAKCECSRCGQVANARPNTGHFSCRGIHKDILAQMPPKFKSLSNPTKKGSWVPVVVHEHQEQADA